MNQIPTIFLHIGYPKTGSTHIQKTCFINRKRLENSGFYFPSVPGRSNHIELYCYVKPLAGANLKSKYSSKSEFVKEFNNELFNALNKGMSVILSNEHLARKLKTSSEVRRMAELLQIFNVPIKIILYLRRQDEFMLSWYNTYVIDGGLKDLDQIKFDLDYKVLVQRWMNFFGKKNIILRIYNRSQLVKQDISMDFLNAIGIEDSQNFAIPKKGSNISLDAQKLRYIQMFYQSNNSSNVRNKGKTKAGLELLRSLKSLENNGHKISYSLSKRMQILNDYSVSNQWVGSQFFGSKNLFLLPKKDQDIIPSLTFEEFQDITFKIWNSLDHNLIKIGNR